MSRSVPTSHALVLTTLCASASLFAIEAAQAATIPAASRIGAVTLYPDAAVIQRQLSVELPVGEHEIVLGDLPAALDPSSLRVEGTGGEKVLIGGIEFRNRADTPAAEKPETERKLKTLRAARDHVADKIDAAEGKKAMIQRLATPEPGKDQKTLDVEHWMKAWEIVGKGLQAANEELRFLRNEIERIEAEIAALENHPEIRPHGQEIGRLAAISVEAATATKLTLTVSYRVNGASWRPIYDARLDTRGNAPALDLTRRALIRQNTGEDWKDVPVTLSTLMVNRGTAAPILSGEKIAFFDRPAPSPKMRAPASAEMIQNKMAVAAQAYSEPDSARKPAPVPTEEVQAAFDAGGYQTDISLPGRMTLPSGGAEKSVRLGSDKPEIKLAIRSAPVVDPTAYLEAAFTHKGEAPLLPGDVLLTRDGAFIGKGRFALVASGENTKLGFGADDRVKITRVPVSRQAKEPGLLGSTKTDEFQFRTTIRNHHTFPIALNVEDRVPVSEDQTITVERLGEMSKPDIETPDDRRGVVVWTPVLKPQEERSFMTAYRIRWPAGRETRLQPLPR